MCISYTHTHLRKRKINTHLRQLKLGSNFAVGKVILLAALLSLAARIVLLPLLLVALWTLPHRETISAPCIVTTHSTGTSRHIGGQCVVSKTLDWMNVSWWHMWCKMGINVSWVPTNVSWVPTNVLWVPTNVLWVAIFLPNGHQSVVNGHQSVVNVLWVNLLWWSLSWVNVLWVATNLLWVTKHVLWMCCESICRDTICREFKFICYESVSSSLQSSLHWVSFIKHFIVYIWGTPTWTSSASVFASAGLSLTPCLLFAPGPFFLGKFSKRAD